jgi:hypothetical protein
MAQVRERFAAYPNPLAVAEDLAAINAYPNLDRLSPPQSAIELGNSSSLDRYRELGREIVLNGGVFWEHTAAGEGSRLGLGLKFFVKPSDLDPVWNSCDLCLGLRRLARFVFEIMSLAEAFERSPTLILNRQKILVVSTDSAILPLAERILTAFGDLVPPSNWFFLGQASFWGLNRRPGQDWAYDHNSPKRLHNHGALAMQKTMEGQVFRLDKSSGTRRPLSQADFFSLLGEFDDLVSLNVEDLDYLTKALDFETLGLATDLGRQGYGMVMEITGNNPNRPIKGGLFAYDEALGRDVVIESFRLLGVEPQDIKLLNKNFNHYPRPAVVFERLNAEGLFMPALVSEGFLYFQPVQGDLNFLTPTAYFIRPGAKGINSLKSLADAPAALASMWAQDQDPKFLAFLRSIERRLSST